MLALTLLLLLLVIGYLIPHLGEPIEKNLARASNALVNFILLLLGASISAFDIDFSDAGTLLLKVAVFALLTLLFNLAALHWIERRQMPSANSGTHEGSALFTALKGALLPLTIVLAGALIALLVPAIGKLSQHAISLALYLLLALVGHQLRASRIGLRQALLNLDGVRLAGVVAVTSLLAALLAAPLLNLPVTASLALGSGFGWYSLSAVLLNHQVNPALGAMALFNDLFREVIAIVLLPMLGRRHAGMAIGYCGSTAMDMTLPFISRYAGPQRVPMALSCGALLSLAAPLLMAFFAALS